MIVISSGHGLHVPGAIGPEPWGLDEVAEARRVVAEVASYLKMMGHEVHQLHDNVSYNQSDNLNWIVDHHNQFPAEGRRDVSVHFNAYQVTAGGRGTECLYLTQEELATNIATAVSGESGLINRGAHKRSDLFFLNGTTGSLGAVLIEVCFVDAESDVQCYDQNFAAICQVIAEELVREKEAPAFYMTGKVSWFGGPHDDGVTPSEGLAFLTSVDQAPEIFLDYQPEGTTGLARRLDAEGSSYIAMRFDYDQFSKAELASGEIMFNVFAPKTGRQVKARPADWGPHTSTNRVADVSPAVLAELGIETDDDVEVTLA